MHDEAFEEVVEEAPRRYPSTIGGAFYLSILAVAGTALFITYRHDWRLGIQILGGSCLAAALIRLVLPTGTRACSRSATGSSTCPC